jgi:hypothetical protein
VKIAGETNSRRSLDGFEPIANPGSTVGGAGLKLKENARVSTLVSAERG